MKKEPEQQEVEVGEQALLVGNTVGTTEGFPVGENV